MSVLLRRNNKLLRPYKRLAVQNPYLDSCCRGACCVGSSCIPNTYRSWCLSNGGVWRKDKTCDPNPCLGACCLDDEDRCVDNTTQDQCTALGGTSGSWYGGMTCASQPCSGACCFEDGTCRYYNRANCNADGGAFNPFTPCTPNPCVGACCIGVPGNPCQDNRSPQQCEALDGDYFPGESCSNLDCIGACCIPAFPDAPWCMGDMTRSQCHGYDGIFQGVGTSCQDEGICPEVPCYICQEGFIPEGLIITHYALLGDDCCGTSQMQYNDVTVNEAVYCSACSCSANEETNVNPIYRLRSCTPWVPDCGECGEWGEWQTEGLLYYYFQGVPDGEGGWNVELGIGPYRQWSCCLTVTPDALIVGEGPNRIDCNMEATFDIYPVEGYCPGPGHTLDCCLRVTSIEVIIGTGSSQRGRALRSSVLAARRNGIPASQSQDVLTLARQRPGTTQPRLILPPGVRENRIITPGGRGAKRIIVPPARSTQSRGGCRSCQGRGKRISDAWPTDLT